jgi:hypothetical protein
MRLAPVTIDVSFTINLLFVPSGNTEKVLLSNDIILAELLGAKKIPSSALKLRGPASALIPAPRICPMLSELEPIPAKGAFVAITAVREAPVPVAELTTKAGVPENLPPLVIVTPVITPAVMTGVNTALWPKPPSVFIVVFSAK